MGIMSFFCWASWSKKTPRKVGKPGKTFPRRVVKTQYGLAVADEPVEHQIKREVVYISPTERESDGDSDRSVC